MELHNLKVVEGSQHTSRRVGRGLGSGMGKTSTRGQKGAGARSGGSIHPGFEGGQLPLYRRFPKRGFRSIRKHDYIVINVADLASVAKSLNLTKVTETDIINYGFVKTRKSALRIDRNSEFLDYYSKRGVKVIGNEKIDTALEVEVSSISAGAKASIENAKGKVTLINKD